MKYIQVLYIYTYGNKIIIKKLTETFNIAKNADLLDSLDFDTTFIEHVKMNYYNRRGELKEPINIPDFLDDYMNFYARTNGYYSGQDQILIFKKIFFKKLKLKSSGQPIPCFWLNYDFVGHINSNILPTNHFQETEVSDIKWLNYEECLQYIRPYNLEKCNILTKLNNVLTEYSLY